MSSPSVPTDPIPKPANYLYLEAAQRRFFDVVAVCNPKPKETAEVIYERFLTAQKKCRYRGDYRKHLVYACIYYNELSNYEFRKNVSTRYNLEHVKLGRCLENIRNSDPDKKEDPSEDSDSSDY
jgi:hypothetical protein